MTEHTFDMLARGAASPTRRGALAALGGMSLLPLVDQDWVTAGKSKKDKKKKKRARKQGKKKCQNQTGTCEDFFETLCRDLPNAGECEAAFSACCVFLGPCDATAFFDCIFTSGI